MLEIVHLIGRQTGNIDDAELRLAAQIGLKQDIYSSMLSVDLEAERYLGFEIARLLKKVH
jgi:hypothetical protein